VCLVFVDILQLLVPRITKRAFDGLAKGTIDSLTLARFGLYLVALAGSIAFFRFGWRYLVLGFSRLFERDLRQKLFDRLLLLDRSFFLQNPPGNIMALSSNDLAAVQLACGMGLIAAADALFMGIATLCFMVYIHAHLALLAVLPMPILAILTTLLSAKLHHRYRLVQEQFEKLTEFSRTSLSTIRLLKAYTQEAPQTARFAGLGKTYIDQNIKLAYVQGVLWPFSGLIANISLLIVVYVGGRLTIRGSITIGDFVAFMSYLAMLTWPMMAIGWVTNLFQRGITSLERLQRIYQSRPVLQQMAKPRPLPGRPERITVRQLSFAYPGSADNTITDINAEFGTGITGITGRTGCGKTTLAHVLTRMYPIERGTYLINGIDVCALGIEAVRALIAYVPQDGLLFSDTVSANLSFGRPEASQKKIEHIARLVMLHDEIAAMPDGYQSLIGEKGVKLSGGQRQRIALGRALLLDRPVLIIDDGMSAVDASTEHAILENCLPLFKNRICIFISHRLTAFTEAGQIFVMDKGRITDHGDHRQLMESNLFYRTIYQYQISGASSKEVDDA
ncbi:MAG: ABC transporter ATP-binding protein, partial [Deltaproteobacteria bacterium]